MREKPLTPWVVAECTGKILAAHCDCVAGLGETSSHVASLLFAIESGVRIRLLRRRRHIGSCPLELRKFIMLQ